MSHYALDAGPGTDFETHGSYPKPVRLGGSVQLWLGVGLLTALVLFSFAGPLFDHRNPLAINVSNIAHPPSWRWPLGTDLLGRDELIRMMIGGRQLIFVGLTASAAATAFGAVIGLVAGLTGGWLDRAITWITDILLGIPQLLPILLIDQLLHLDGLSFALVVAATVWPVVSRLTRAEALSVRERDYILASRSLGAGNTRIVLHHLLPNLWTTILMAASNLVGTSVLVVATASFLSLGLPPPAPNWGSMVADAAESLTSGYWWMMAWPAAAFVLLQLGANLVADAMRKYTAMRGAH